VIPPSVVEGHFVLESGLHTNRWYRLDAMFCDPRSIAPQIARLADLLAPHHPTAICGPMSGGALLAQAVAMQMGLRFLFTRRSISDGSSALFAARYELPSVQLALASGQRIGLVDDMISAGSSTRASLAALSEAGAVVVAVGAVYLSGDVATDHFASHGIPVVAVERRPLDLWQPDDCPHCLRGEPLSTPAD
jgi:orotate phosphoribosyltransferase